MWGIENASLRADILRHPLSTGLTAVDGGGEPDAAILLGDASDADQPILWQGRNPLFIAAFASAEG
jgi:hypothetical protein